MTTPTHREHGFTLLELMVAIALSTFIVALVLTVFFKQQNFITHESQRQATAYEARLGFMIIDRLIRQAESASIVVDYGGKGALNEPQSTALESDEITVDFTLPSGYPIWPNDISPYDRPAVRLHWSSAPGPDQHVVSYATAPNMAGLAAQTLAPLIGGASKYTPLIVNFDLWPLQDNGLTPQPKKSDPAKGGYLLSVSTRSGSPDPTYQNPAYGEKHPLRHFYVHTASSAVTPRN